MIKKIYSFLTRNKRNSYSSRLKRAKKIAVFRPCVTTRGELNPKLYAAGDMQGIKAYVMAMHNRRVLSEKCKNFGRFMRKYGVSIKNIGMGCPK